jgi:hypothetical protein
MAQRSSGIFPREGFNLDNSFEVTTVSADAPVSLNSIRTLRLIIVGLVETAPTGDYTNATLTYQIGGDVFAVDPAQVDLNGVYIAHHRGYGRATNAVQYTITASTGTTGTPGDITLGGMFIELVDGPAR